MCVVCECCVCLLEAVFYALEQLCVIVCEYVCLGLFNC